MYAETADTERYVEKADTGRYVETADTGLYMEKADTGLYMEKADTGLYIETADTERYVETADTERYVEKADTGRYVEKADTGRYVEKADTGQYVNSLARGKFIKQADTVHYVETADTQVKTRKGGWTMGDRKKKKMSTEEIHGLTYNMVTHALWILFMVVFALVIVYGAKKAYDFGYAVFSTKDRAVRGSEVTISILEGSSVMTVGKQLEANGYLDNYYVFWAQSVLFDYEVKPGVYTFNSKSSSRALLELFDKGPETADE